MKPKEFKNLIEAIQNKHNEIYYVENEKNKNWEQYTKLKHQLKDLRLKLEQCETVNVSFNIGCRGYYEKAYKVGKFYYTVGSLTKLTTYYDPKMIPEITQKMKDEMIADSYYY